jgi:nicotinamidase/pyrazinamidase
MGSNALIVVDMQNDFLPNGALGVKDGDVIIPIINRLLRLPFDVRVASLDWHPKGHCSFASTWNKKPRERIIIEGIEQKLWPDHCVQGTKGAEFSSEINVSLCDHIVHKGTEVMIDSYSAFFDNQKRRSTGLDAFLKHADVQDLYIAGLTTEYCVLYSVMDALELGFSCHVIIDACRGIDVEKGDVAKAIDIMKERGVEIVTSDIVEKRFS